MEKFLTVTEVRARRGEVEELLYACDASERHLRRAKNAHPSNEALLKDIGKRQAELKSELNHLADEQERIIENASSTHKDSVGYFMFQNGNARTVNGMRVTLLELRDVQERIGENGSALLGDGSTVNSDSGVTDAIQYLETYWKGEEYPLELNLHEAAIAFANAREQQALCVQFTDKATSEWENLSRAKAAKNDIQNALGIDYDLSGTVYENAPSKNDVHEARKKLHEARARETEAELAMVEACRLLNHATVFTS